MASTTIHALQVVLVPGYNPKIGSLVIAQCETKGFFARIALENGSNSAWCAIDSVDVSTLRDYERNPARNQNFGVRLPKERNTRNNAGIMQHLATAQRKGAEHAAKLADRSSKIERLTHLIALSERVAAKKEVEGDIDSAFDALEMCDEYRAELETFNV